MEVHEREAFFAQMMDEPEGEGECYDPAGLKMNQKRFGDILAGDTDPSFGQVLDYLESTPTGEVARLDQRRCALLSSGVRILLRRCAELEAAQEWVPVEQKESSPGEVIICRQFKVSGSTRADVSAGHYHDKKWRLSNMTDAEYSSLGTEDGDGMLARVTHYMALPLPPTNSKDK